jgi:hypothetical protein
VSEGSDVDQELRTAQSKRPQKSIWSEVRFGLRSARVECRLLKFGAMVDDETRVPCVVKESGVLGSLRCVLVN